MLLPHACLFDLDGVLIDTEPLHSRAWKEAAASFGTKINEEQLKLLKGRRRVDCAKQILKWSTSTIDLNEFLSAHEPIARKHLRKSESIPGAKELVQWCFDQKLPIALVTSSSRSSVKFKSAAHPWLEKISTRVFGDDNELIEGKPAPDPFLLAASRLNTDPKKCWAIEDSISGAQSALKAGCLVWLVNNKKEDVLKKIPTYLRNNIIEINNLKEILLSIKKASRS